MLLILTSRNDIHADAAADALQRLGAKCVILRQEDFPQALAASISNRGDVLLYDDAGAAYSLSAFRAVWNRRSTNPLPPPYLSAEDQELSYRTSKKFLEWLNLSRPRDQVWINDPDRASYASNKATQLKIAHEVGFSVPETLITNHPGAAREFVAAGESIVKPISPMFWKSESNRVATASRITLPQMGSDKSLAACPMIYQRLVRKKYELRIVVFGKEIVAARIDSQRDERSRIDFRAGDYFKLKLDEVDLDIETRNRIAAFMARLGLIHGSFDLVVNDDGETVFLELNEQGQMSWIEDRNPSVRVFDRICAFLQNPSPDFLWDGVKRFAFEEFRRRHEYEDVAMAGPQGVN